MKKTILFTGVLCLSALLAACGQDEAPKEREKNFGAGLGETYKGMLDEAGQAAGQVNAHMERTEQAVRERNE
jgi:hypothetical protein